MRTKKWNLCNLLHRFHFFESKSDARLRVTKLTYLFSNSTGVSNSSRRSLRAIGSWGS